jgi:fumarate reductase flavoprotein subunit
MTGRDVLVIGAGMAGLSAALAAAQAGASVVVLEADDEPGGSARWSAGTIWSMNSYEELRTAVPLGDAALQRVVADGLADGLAWLQAAGLPLEIADRDQSRGGGKVMALGERGDRRAFMQAFADVAAHAGAEFCYRHRVTGVERHAVGFIVTTNAVTFDARTIVIASGGFQAERTLLRTYLGPESDNAMLRTSDNAKGDGFLIGLNSGGTTSRGLGGFYGHTMPRFSEFLAPAEYKNLTLAMSTRALLVNDDGMRFCDEAETAGEENNPVAGMYQPGGRYYLICDTKLAAQLPLAGIRRLAGAADVSETQIIIHAPTLDELAAAMQDSWSVDHQRLVQTLAVGAEASNTGDASLLVPHRSGPPVSLQRAPFYAIACIAGLTYCYGGLAVDDAMRLRAATGGTVDDIFVAGNDAGGVYMRTYAGGLAWALVSGRKAGSLAAGST